MSTKYSMKIYFCGSITAGRQDVDLYNRIITLLQTYGDVLTTHVGANDADLETFEAELSATDIHHRHMAWLTEANAVAAEVTQPSLGVGYEIGSAVAMNKKILCLFRPDTGRQLSPMITGAADNTSVTVRNYHEGELANILTSFFNRQL